MGCLLKKQYFVYLSIWHCYLILSQSDDEFLKSSKYITDQNFGIYFLVKWDSSFLSLRYCLNLGSVLIFRLPNVGTVLIFRIHNVGTVPTFEMDNLWAPWFYDSFHKYLGLKDSDWIRYEITSYRVIFWWYFRWWHFIWWQYEIFIPITSHHLNTFHTKQILK